MEYQKIGVIGAGVIGAGVTQRLARFGLNVVLIDIDDEPLRRARSDIAANLKYLSLFDRPTRELNHSEIMSRIEFTTDYSRLENVELVVENSTEEWSTKTAVYSSLDKICMPPCVFAANTSAISISRLGSMTRRPDKVIGLHFMNPVPQKSVVEVIRGSMTSEDTINASRGLLRQIGMRAIVVNDKPGFVTNRVLMLAINEAIAVIEDNVANANDVDDIFVSCVGHKMGPLATADLIGLDTVLRSLHILFESYCEDKYIPRPMLKRMVEAGHLGRKSGRGFFKYGH